MLFKEFQDGCHGRHLEYRNGMVLAILNLHVASMPHIKFQLNLTYAWVKVQNFQILNFQNSDLKSCNMPTKYSQFEA